MINSKINFCSFVLLFLIIFLSIFQITNAGVSDKLKGYIWSDNIGWISLNCFNENSCENIDYGVTVVEGKLSGFAWSENIGWLDFSYYANTNDAARLNIETGVFSGKAQFLSALKLRSSNNVDCNLLWNSRRAISEGIISNCDGWDGVVTLAGTSPNYNITLNRTSITGYAWGSDVVGWISFNCSNTNSCSMVEYGATYDPFYFLFTANKGTSNNKVAYAGSVILNWTTVGAVSCTASGGDGTRWSSVGSRIGDPSVQTEIITNLIQNKTFILSCLDSAGFQITRTIPVLVKSPEPEITFNANSLNISDGGNVILTWKTKNIVSCTGGGSWSGVKNIGEGSEVVGPIRGDTKVFELVCVASNPDNYPLGSSELTNSIQIYIERPEIELSAKQNPVPFNESIELIYKTEFITSCRATGTVPGFEGSRIDVTSGEHTFLTSGMLDELSYTAILTCIPRVSTQTIEPVELEIRIRKNPAYSEN